MKKVAVLVDPVAGWNGADSYKPGFEIEVHTWRDGTLVYKGEAVAWNGGKVDKISGDRGAWFDFSEVKEPGLYYLYDPANRVRSYPFEIGRNVYKPVLRAATKMFYFNRANFEKEPPYSCVGERCWSLDADNVGRYQDPHARSVTDRNNPKTERDLSGGWWDAGDTNKYVTFANEALHQLLTAYEENPGAFADDFGIPESGNGTPDLLDEVLVELRWIEKMQPKDLEGGVLIKMGSTGDDEVIPDRNTKPRYYYPKPCSSSTIVAAGLFAHAASVFRKVPKLAKLAPEYQSRAIRAWDHFQANPRSDSCDDQTIKAGDADMKPEVQEQTAVTAAVYLFSLTGDPRYDDFVTQHYDKTRPFLEDRWSCYDPSQGDALLYYTSLPGADADVKQKILDRKRSQAHSVDIYSTKPELDLYRAYMRPDSYHWGSNNVRASLGNTNYNVVTYDLASPSDKPNYIERAAGMLHSFHGVNPMQLVYLSNMYAFGADRSVDELFHAWFRDRDSKWNNARSSPLGPAPGYVTGGPNAQYCNWQPDAHACKKSPVRQQPPGKAYVDTNTGWAPDDPYDKSWELTEPAIYYQASYVRLVSKFVD